MINILLLAGNTLRSRAYAQKLNELTGVSISGLFLGVHKKECHVPGLNDATLQYLVENDISVPNFKKCLVTTFSENQWAYQLSETIDVNSIEVLEAIKNQNIDLIIFSGYGGQILNENHFLGDTPYLHMHPGDLPSERGSTTLYYSILKQQNCAVTAFFMNKEIDAGELICCNKYPIPNKNVNIDYYLDNCLRSDCLETAISQIKNNRRIQKNDSSNDYYIIHPLLKHLAILSLK